MNPTIKVVKRNIRGWFSPNWDEEKLAAEIQEQENLGWQLISSTGIATSSLSGRATTDTLVFIYRKK